MYHIYIDERKYPSKNFIIGSYVFCKKNPAAFIDVTLRECGFDPSFVEYKSSTHFGRNPMMAVVKEKLCSRKLLFGDNNLPHSELKELWVYALKALQQFLTQQYYLL